MSDSRPRTPATPPSGRGDLSNEVQGHWELNLWNGTAWFSPWFREQLQWPAEASIKKLDALRPHLQAGAWEALLRAIRAHLEEQLPLDLTIGVQVKGQSRRWQVQGAVERTPAGQPVYLAGTMRDGGTEPP
jgi:hypothetical protein